MKVKQTRSYYVSIEYIVKPKGRIIMGKLDKSSGDSKLFRDMIVLIFVLIIAVCRYFIFDLCNEQTYKVKVTDVYVKHLSKGRNVKMVEAKLMDGSNASVSFSNRDNWWKHKTNSKELQDSLKEGHIYEIKTTGFRLPILGIYENIYELKDLGPKI